MDITSEELNFLNIQTIITWIFIGSFVISLLLVENSKRKLRGEQPFWTDKEATSISKITRILLVVISLIVIWLNIQGEEILIKKGDIPNNIIAGDIEILAAYASLAAAILIALAGIVSDTNSDIINAEGFDL